MFSSPRVSISLGQTEINEVDKMLLASHSDDKVIRLDVTVEELATVNVLNAM